MGLFDNMFGSKKDYKLPDIPDTKVGETVNEAQEKERERKRALPCYQVGLTADNRVTLYIGSDYYGGSTLTMNAQGTRHLIQLLEAAIPKEYDTENEETE